MGSRAATFACAILLLLLVAAVIGAVPAGAVVFSPAVDYPTGASPVAVAAGDFNGDGLKDLVAANSEAATVSVLLSKGTGGFTAKVDYPTGVSPVSVAVGDFGTDGKLDVVTANRDANTIGVLLGRGDGTFAPMVSFPCGSYPTDVAAGDFNHDGLSDLAVANGYDDTVSVFLCNGNGSFLAKTDYPTGAMPYAVAIGDVNGDGNADLVVANNFADTVSVLLGNGNGTFGAKTDFATGADPVAVAIGDVNGDNRPDLVIADEASDAVSVLIGDGTGGFGAPTDYATGAGPSAVALADVDGDGYKDIVTSDFDANTVSVLLGNGDGTFSEPTPFDAGAGPSGVAVADFDGDGIKDIATADYFGDAVSVLAKGEASPTPTLTITAPSGTGTYQVGDNLTVNWTSDQYLVRGEFGVWARSGAGGWYLGKLVPALSGTAFTTDVSLDVPAGDGYQIVIAYRLKSGTGTWGSWTTSSGSFSVVGVGPPAVTITAPTGTSTYAVGDTLTATWTTDRTLSGGEFGVWVRSGTGGWYIGQYVPVSDSASFSTGLVLDVPNGSGYQVIVAYRATPGNGDWGSWATSPGTFTVTGTGPPALTITAPTGTASYSVGDALMVSWTCNRSLGSGEFGVWLRSGSGGWYVGQLVPTNGSASYSTSIDLEVPAGDGYQAIVAYRAASGTGTWGSWATSPGTFSVTGVGPPALTITAPTGTGTYAVGDTLTVDWTSDHALSSGEFGVWVRSGSGGWYLGQIVPASGGTSFSTGLALEVPAGDGYQAIVAYRATVGTGTWLSWATSPGSFSVTGVGPPALTITAPTGTATHAVGDTIAVNWSSDHALSSGEFGVWARSGTGGWYIGALVPASGGTDFGMDLQLIVPAGDGYQVVVAYRSTVGTGTWLSWATSPGSFSVTGVGPPALTITAPTGTATHAVGDTIEVNWSSDQALSSGEFGVWARSGDDAWYLAKLVPASGGTTFGTDFKLDVPTGDGYQIVVAYRTTVGTGTWGSWATSPGTFSVTP